MCAILNVIFKLHWSIKNNLIHPAGGSLTFTKRLCCFATSAVSSNTFIVLYYAWLHHSDVLGFAQHELSCSRPKYFPSGCPKPPTPNRNPIFCFYPPTFFFSLAEYVIPWWIHFRAGRNLLLNIMRCASIKLSLNWNKNSDWTEDCAKINCN